MKKVITYGTFDVLHQGHIRLIERAKALGDYLIVGVTSDDYDRARGKINNRQSLHERVCAVEALGLADEVIVEEYEGQKIEDILRFGIDIFTVGSDWTGKYDYLKEYCNVVYLPRTEGISSTELRSKQRGLRIGIVGNTAVLHKFISESKFVNGIEIIGIHCSGDDWDPSSFSENILYFSSYEELLEKSDAVYVVSMPKKHYSDIRSALLAGKHVICESPIALSKDECDELYELADQNNCVLMDLIKTAYSVAYQRLILIIKTGRIGQVVSVDAVCTNLQDNITDAHADLSRKWNSICAWAPTALLPVFHILGVKAKNHYIITKLLNNYSDIDLFTKIDFVYNDAVASIKIAKGAKSEGQLIITGTKGYVFVPAPWWKTDYFELRYENPGDNRRYYYQLDGEGIRHAIVAFADTIEKGRKYNYISTEVSQAISEIIEDFYSKKNYVQIN